MTKHKCILPETIWQELFFLPVSQCKCGNLWIGEGTARFKFLIELIKACFHLAVGEAQTIEVATLANDTELQNAYRDRSSIHSHSVFGFQERKCTYKCAKTHSSCFAWGTLPSDMLGHVIRNHSDGYAICLLTKISLNPVFYKVSNFGFCFTFYNLFLLFIAQRFIQLIQNYFLHNSVHNT